MALLSKDELKTRIKMRIPKQAAYRDTQLEKMENIQAFDSLSRDGLKYKEKEKRILLYETKNGEKIYVQYPGKETERQNSSAYMLDTRPMLQKRDGTFINEMDFKKIWDIIDVYGQNHRADMNILATLFLRIALMWNYEKICTMYPYETIDINNNTIIDKGFEKIKWNYLKLDDDVIDTINNDFGNIPDLDISLESFLYYNDLLAQNEDCKYHYRKQSEWDYKVGRVNNCLSHLSIIAHVKGKIGISELLNRFQNGRGVGPIKIKEIKDVCDNLVELY